MFLDEVILNKLNLINHKKKFINLKIFNEYKQCIIIKNLFLLHNKCICQFFIDLYYKGYGIEILKFIFYKNLEYFFIKKYSLKIKFFIMFDDNIDFYHDLYLIIQNKDINLIETFIHIIYKYKSTYDCFTCLKKLLQNIINFNDFIFFTKYYNIIKEIHNNYYSINIYFLNIFSNITINNANIFEYCHNLGLVSNKNKSNNLIKWYNRKNYIIFISGYLKNKPDKTKIFTNHDIAKYICYYL
jgi:hypothetical protein